MRCQEQGCANDTSGSSAYCIHHLPIPPDPDAIMRKGSGVGGAALAIMVILVYAVVAFLLWAAGLLQS